MQIHSFSRGQLYSDITAGIGKLHIFPQLSEPDIDITTTSAGIQATGKIAHFYIAAAGPGIELTVDLLPTDISSGSVSPVSAFQQPQFKVPSGSSKVQVPLAMRGFDITAAGSQIEIIF